MSTRRRRRRGLQLRLTTLYAVPFIIAVTAGIALFSFGESVSAPASETVGDVRIIRDPPTDFYEERMFRVIALTVLIASVVAVIGGWITAGRLLRPLRAIIATAQDISATSLDRRLGKTGDDDEFTDLAETLDSVFERLEAAFASQRRFVANASHELRTPLAAERALLQVALADPDATADTLREACREVLALGAAQERLVDALLTLASGEQGVEQAEPVDLAEIAAAAIRRRSSEAKVRGVRVDATLGPAVGAGDPRLAESLVANLVDNAVRYNIDGGWIEVVTSTVQDATPPTTQSTGSQTGRAAARLAAQGAGAPVRDAPGPAAGDGAPAARGVGRLLPWGAGAPVRGAAGATTRGAGSTVREVARLTVRNTGPAVPAEEIGRLLQPFQRLEGQRIGRAASGHGLGLAIVQAIATAHGATLRVLPRPEGGLDVTVDFPLPVDRIA
ncbi:HAMP domain-containing sensor histidine kinase [Dactylosporangium sp. NPDC006015]|uniref:sensor histidine kinase n=1 Tax=Dactylosporangium sp. NPDC006015 TaxID=3154576 RepID=UPI0033AAA515